MKQVLLTSIAFFAILTSFGQTGFDYNKAKKPQLITELVKQGFKESDISMAKRKDLATLYGTILKVNDLDQKLTSSLDSSYISYVDSNYYIHDYQIQSKLESAKNAYRSITKFRQDCIDRLSSEVKSAYISNASFGTTDAVFETLTMSAKASIESYNHEIITYADKLIDQLQPLHSFLKEESIRHSLELAKEQEQLAERKRQAEEYEKQQEAARLAELERRRAEAKAAEEWERKREAEIAKLPSKAEINAKFRAYKHKTGHIFEIFPVGFTPKPNKSTYDRGQLFGRTYTISYREHNDYGVNSLLMEFYDSGKISTVYVYDGAETIYHAKYRDGANKPYEIMSKTPDGNFRITFKRIYDIYEDKVNESTSYYYVPLDYYFD